MQQPQQTVKGSKGDYIINWDNNIDEGSYGAVFTCKHIQTDQVFAIKIISASKTSIGIYNKEIEILKKVQNLKGASKVVDWGQQQLCGQFSYFIIMEKLGQTVYQASQYPFLSIKETMQVGLSLLSTLERLHDLEYLHGDIKPNNIMLPENEISFSQVILIDFGRCRKFMSQEGKHKPNTRCQFNFNEWFVSCNQCKGSSLSRRDDIISLLYTLIHCRDNYQNLLTKVSNEQQVKNFKVIASAQDMCQGYRTQFLTPLLEEAMQYEYEQKPNFEKLRFMMKKILIENGIKPSRNFVFDQNLQNEQCDDTDVDERSERNEFNETQEIKQQIDFGKCYDFTFKSNQKF